MSGQLLSSKVVIVEEEPKVRGIPSAPTSVAGAVGVTERGPIGEAADRRPGHHAHGVADLGEELEILEPALAGADPLEHPQRPGRSLAARRALPAGFVGEEPAGIVEEVDDAHCLVDDDDSGRAEAEAADLAGAGEVERRVEFGLRQQSHRDSAGDHGLRLPPLPHSAPLAVDELAGGDAEGGLVATGAFNVSGEAIELRPVAPRITRVVRVGGNADPGASIRVDSVESARVE